MSDDLNHVLHEADAILRVAAPIEHPCNASELVVTFGEIGLPVEVASAMRGFSARQLDAYAAWLRRDETLIGRPVFALDVDWYADKLDGTVSKRTAVLNGLRDTSLHELAHAALARRDQPAETITPEDYPAWLGREFKALDNTKRASGHNPKWWRLYVSLVARVGVIAPRLVCRDSLAAAAETYCYGGRRMADAWLAAVKTAPGYLDAPLVELASSPCAAFDALVNALRPATAEPSSADRLSAS